MIEGRPFDHRTNNIPKFVAGDNYSTQEGFLTPKTLEQDYKTKAIEKIEKDNVHTFFFSI